MNDPFSEKRGMVQMLLKMLKKHASDEVGSGLKHPEGEGDMHGLQAEKVEDLPNHEMDASTPEHEVDTKLIPEDQHTANMGYSKGGVVEKVNATDPTPKIHSGPIPYESAEGHPDTRGAVQEEANEPLDEREAEIPEENGSLFDNFLRPLKKRKSPIK
jgi:hypothetical protein